MEAVEGTPVTSAPAADAAVVASTTADSGAAAAAAAPVTEVVDNEALTDLEILNQEEPKPEVKTEPAADKAATEEPKPEVKTEAKPAEKKTPEQKAAEEEAAAAVEPGDKAVSELREAISKDAELKAAFDKNPHIRNLMFRNARLAVDAAAFKEHFATVELAKMARADSEDLGEIETDYFSGNEQGYGNLLKRMWEADLKRDPITREPIKDARGNFQPEGKWDSFFAHYRATEFYPSLLALAKQHGKDAEVSEAVRLIQEFLGETDGATGAKPAVKEPVVEDSSRLTAEERADLAEHQRLKREQANTAQTTQQTYLKSVSEAVQGGVTDFLLARVKRLAPAMTENLQNKVASDAFTEVNAIAAKDPVFQRLKTQILRAGGDEAKARLRTEAVKYAESRYPDVLRKLVNEYAAPVVQNSEDTRAKLDAQKTRTEVKGGAGAPTPTQQDDASLLSEGDKLSQKVNGRRLNMTEVIDLETIVPELRRKAQAKAAAAR